MSWGYFFINFNCEFIQGFHIDTKAAFHCKHCCQEGYFHIHLDEVCQFSFVRCQNRHFPGATISRVSGLTTAEKLTCWSPLRYRDYLPGEESHRPGLRLPSLAGMVGREVAQRTVGARHVPLHRTPWLFLTQEQSVIHWYGSAPYWMVIAGVTTTIITQSTHDYHISGHELCGFNEAIFPRTAINIFIVPHLVFLCSYRSNILGYQ